MATFHRQPLSAMATLALLLLFISLVNSVGGEEAAIVGRAARRMLIGPGSWPPTCHARCGRCHPCRAVHVAVHPSRIVPLDYYPEAWRCKCGAEFFMP